MFASASYVVVDVAKGELRSANAGHPEPLSIRQEAGMRQAMPLRAGKRDPVLGIFEDAAYGTSQTKLSPGDMVLFFTDGLFEVEGADGALYDEKLLIDAVNRRANLTAASLLPNVLAEVRQFAANQRFSDDVCLVAMEVDRIGG
jgi:sigma-B regulation protein RsbU (phosphoserine phosphatase)